MAKDPKVGLRFLGAELPYSLRWFTSGWRDYTLQYIQALGCIAVGVLAFGILVRATSVLDEASADLVIAAVLGLLAVAALPRDKLGVLRRPIYTAASVGEAGIRIPFADGWLEITWPAVSRVRTGWSGIRFEGETRVWLRIPNRVFRDGAMARKFRDEVSRRSGSAPSPSPSPDRPQQGLSVAYVREWKDLAPSPRTLLLIAGYLICAVVLTLIGLGIVSLVGINVTGITEADPAPVAPYLLAALLSLVLGLERVFAIHRSRRGIGEPMRVSVEADGLYVAGRGWTAMYPWNQVTRTTSGNRGLRLFRGRTEIALLPDRALAASSDGQAIRATLRTHIQAARSLESGWSQAARSYGDLDFGDGQPTEKGPGVGAQAPVLRGISDQELAAAFRQHLGQGLILAMIAIAISVGAAWLFQPTILSVELVGIALMPLVLGLTGLVFGVVFARRRNERATVLTWWLADVAGPSDMHIRAFELDAARALAAEPGSTEFERARVDALIELRKDIRPDLAALEVMAATDPAPDRAGAVVDVVRALVAFRDGGPWGDALDHAYPWVRGHLSSRASAYLQLARRRIIRRVALLGLVTVGLLALFTTVWPVDTWPIVGDSDLVAGFEWRNVDSSVSGQHRSFAQDQPTLIKAVTILLDTLPKAIPDSRTAPDGPVGPTWIWEPSGDVPELPANAPTRTVRGVSLFLAPYFASGESVLAISYTDGSGDHFYTIPTATMKTLADLIYPVDGSGSPAP